MPSSEDAASPLSAFFMTYLNPLLTLGFKKDLEHEDLGETSVQDQSGRLFETFNKHWQDEMKLNPEKRSLWKVMWKTVGYGKLVLSITLYAFYAGISFGPIMILNRLTQHFEGVSVLPAKILWILVALVFVLPMLASLLAAQSNIIMAHFGMQFRNALINAIYRKALKLSPASRQKQSTGMIVNMFSNDTGQLQRFLFFLNNCALAPAQIAVALALIYQQVGPSTFVGLGFMLILMPFNGIIFGMLMKTRRLKVKETDTRVKLMNEILAGIRVIKYYAWEAAFEEKITKIRAVELNLLKEMAYIAAFGFTLVLQAAPVVQPILIFFTYVKLGNHLDAATAFTTIALFNLMQFPFAFLPMGLAQYSQSLVSTKRMQDFFASEELEEYVHTEAAADGSVVSLAGVHMCWIRDGDEEDTPAPQGPSKGEKAKKEYIKLASPNIAKPAANVTLKSLRVDAAVNQKAADDKATKPGSEYAAVASDETEGKEGGKEGEGVVSDPKAYRSKYTLIDINLNIKRGELVAVIGAVGCGKSSLLSTLLGEMNLQSGLVRVAGSIAYCDQRPWILNATVKDNILFGLDYDEARFDVAIHAASLEDDIKVLPGGVLTEIGERGINLSGGQKARVALARAVYKDRDIYLLDDPLSAVDAHVGQHIFNECICGALKGKTRILVTHQVHLLHQCDQIVVLDDGKVRGVGSYEQLLAQGIDIAQLVPATTQPVDDKAEGALVASKPDSAPSDALAANPSADKAVAVAWPLVKPSSPPSSPSGTTTPSAAVVAAVPEHQVEVAEVVAIDDNGADAANAVSVDATATPLVEKSLSEQGESKDVTGADVEAPPARDSVATYSLSKDVKEAAEVRHEDTRSSSVVQMEEKNMGDVLLSTYSYYIQAGGIFMFSMVLLFLILSQLLTLLASFYLAYWGTETVRRQRNGHPMGSMTNVQYLNTYAWLTMLGVAAITVRAYVLANHRLGTSLKLHSRLLKRLLAAPVAFFDVTPIGRILNRFSSDMVVVDEELSQTISQVSNSLFACLGAMGAIAGATKGTFLILMVPLIFAYESVQRYFRKTNTVVARLEAISRSPIYADFSQALVGVSSIRAYGEQNKFIDRLEQRVDRNTIAGVTTQLAANWLAIRLDFLGSLISFFIALIAAASGGFIPAGFVALGLSYSFQLTTYLKFAVRMLASGEAQMNSVERIIYYIDNIPQEGITDVPTVEPPPSWPSQGAIEGENVQMRYRDGPLVLKGFDFKVKGGEKIGIAGRTGSGKSSMMIALFRIEELAAGKISIDGVDIKTVPLTTLRSKLGIIPQDPVMFSASVRFNLDPFNEHSDEEVWDTLSRVGMKDHVSTLPNKLDEEVAEGGDNFSAGQRQLICIGRALLRNPRILVLDEATASIDNDTDEMIQRMIRSSFKECTVLTIAHRLHTIIDSNRIMVLDYGLLAEMDAPEALSGKEDGLFKGLWDRHQKSHNA